MVDHAANPQFVELTFKVNNDTYTEHVTSAKFVKTDPKEASYTDVGGKVHKRVGKAGRALNVNLIHDWTATGLARMFWEHEGDQADVSMSDETGAWSATINIVAPDPGGEGATFAQDALSLPVDGEVTFAPAAP